MHGSPTNGRRGTRRIGRTLVGLIGTCALVFGLMPSALASGALDVTVYVQDKTYDGTTAATISVCVVDPTNVESGDTVSCDLGATSAVFDAKDVNAAQTVTATVVLQYGGSNTGTYSLGTVTEIPAAISARTLIVSLDADDKTYDATTTATGTLDDDGLVGDDVDATSTSIVFDDANVGTGKTVTASGLALTGTDAGNYTLDGVTQDTDLADISERVLVATLAADDKTYDTTTTATGTLSDDGLVGDDVDVTATSIDFDDANVGTGKTVTASGLALTGTDAGNYTLDGVTQVTDLASITGPVVAYTGDTYIVASGGSTVSLSALASNEGTCAGTISFSVEDVTDTEVYSGAAGTTGVLASGIYTVAVTYGSDPFDANCVAVDAAVITIVSAGGATNGGGWYRRGTYTGDGSSRANFGFVLNKTYTGTGKTKTWSGYRGDLVWLSGEGWRVKARLSGDTNYFGTFPCPGTVGATGSGASCGSFRSSGVLQSWDATANGGLGDWAFEANVSFTVTIYDGGSVTVCKRKTCTKTDLADWFGIDIDGYSSAQLPETTPAKLVQPSGKGSIRVLP